LRSLRERKSLLLRLKEKKYAEAAKKIHSLRTLREILFQNSGYGSMKVDISDFKQGIYSIYVRDNNENNFVKKFVKL